MAESQLASWSKGSGFYYWNYKLLTDTVNTPGWIGWDAWDRLVSEDEVADWLRSLPADDPQLSWQVEPRLADGTPAR